MKRILLTTLALIVATWATLVVGASPASASTAGAATLAAANFTKTAGTCAQNPTANSLGGSQFEHSCAGGYSGGPEYWCADFAKWVWRNSGLNVSGLTAAAQSFYTYGQSHGTFHSTAQPGDAVVYSSSPGGYADHVAIVTAVNADGSVVTANGDWGGQSGTMAHFAVTSSVVKVTIPAASASTGSWVAAANYYITGIVGASGSGGSAPPEGSGSPYSAASICGSGYGVVDSHDLGAATVFLLYDDDSGKNCVVTLADADGGAVAMNATLQVQGSSQVADPGNYDWYAGPVTAYAPNACVKWGGTYKTSTWTSDYGHCGSGDGSPAPTGSNPYSAGAACGAGYQVVDHHALPGATVYLLYSNATGDNCVVTLYTDVAGKVAGNATLAVQGGQAASNPGSFTYYAGPVYELAPNSCVKWGGSNGSATWTSDYGHCGSGSSTANPYTAAAVCGSGYTVIDSRDLGSATVYLLYNGGANCVVTMAHNGNGPVGLNATLSVQGGSSASNPGLFEWYAGPVRLSAAGACVKWGGSYESTSWVSDWSHCV
ncbi:CHAP domain-containing protein [Actinoplanes sp. TBRC 11911]|uniref:CHAP domain-containing protein n=1 Tax=Actinoplanes sp. TBRC 11911 TaxID=2729386 RepID=UPI001B7D5992|nr:CHAP domain-containing protein [Actinoplanes sp. TBRC 11911]